MNDVADLQAQIIALRFAIEGTWLSLRRSDPAPLGPARRRRRGNVAAVGQLDASNPDAQAMRDAVAAHTDRLWGSIEWQLQQETTENTGLD